MNEPTFDFLGFLADDRFGITYKPRWNAVTGSITASVLLQQMIFRWAHNGRRPFYKFARPCAHRLYRAGDSWEEELGMKRREFENARDALATRTRGDMAPDALVSYWVDAQRVTWYAINEAVLLERFTAVYPKAVTGIQLPLPAAESQSASPPALMDETYTRSNGRNVHQANGQLMDETSISANGRFVHQPMDETSITTDAPNVHPLYSQNEINQQRSPQTTTAAPAAAESNPPPSAAAADYRAAILDWIAFDDALTDKERRQLDVATLMAWAYWVKLKQAERSSRVYNPVGLVRAQWRNNKQPRADLLRLARGWLFLDDDGRARLLGRLEWAADNGTDPGAPLEDDFPDIPPQAAAAVYTATYGELAPPALSPAEPVRPTDRLSPAVQRAASPSRSVAQTAPSQPTAALWRDALSELEMQMTRSTFHQWLIGTTATLTGDELTVHVRNHYAVDWLSGRLHNLITRTVTGVAGRPITVRYESPDAQPEVQHG